MNRYGVDTDYFYKSFERISKNLDNYKPQELIRALERLADAVRPMDKCLDCGGHRLAVAHTEDFNQCSVCGNLQKIKGE